MLRITKQEALVSDRIYVEAACLSTDDKPEGVATGSLCLEVDTGDVYAFDEEDAEWNKIASLGGG